MYLFLKLKTKVRLLRKKINKKLFLLYYVNWLYSTYKLNEICQVFTISDPINTHNSVVDCRLMLMNPEIFLIFFVAYVLECTAEASYVFRAQTGWYRIRFPALPKTHWIHVAYLFVKSVKKRSVVGRKHLPLIQRHGGIPFLSSYMCKLCRSCRWQRHSNLPYIALYLLLWCVQSQCMDIQGDHN